MKIPKIYSVYFAFIILLFFPSKHLELLTILVTSSILLIGFMYKFVLLKVNSFVVFIIFYILLIISVLIGMFYYGLEPIRNFTEIVRFSPIFLLFFVIKNIPENDAIKCIINIFLIYTVSNFIVSISQIALLGFVDPITSIYGSELQREVSLGISSRALGLNSGPGQNGSIMAIVFIFSISQAIVDNYKFRSFLTAVLSFFVVVLSQSQTSFIVCLGGGLYALVFALLFMDKKTKKTALNYIIFIIPLGFYFLIKYSGDLRYLFTLFSHGLKRSSYQARLEKTDYIIDLIFDKPIPLIFGHGKEYFGPVSGHMDNEYIFYLGVYGLLSTIMIILFYLYVLLLPYIYKDKYIKSNNFLFSLHMLVLVGVVMAWPSVFITDVRIAFILAFIYLMFISTRNTLKRN